MEIAGAEYAKAYFELDTNRICRPRGIGSIPRGSLPAAISADDGPTMECYRSKPRTLTPRTLCQVEIWVPVKPL